jgi:hypothetical protein
VTHKDGGFQNAPLCSFACFHHVIFFLKKKKIDKMCGRANRDRAYFDLLSFFFVIRQGKQGQNLPCPTSFSFSMAMVKQGK